MNAAHVLDSAVRSMQAVQIQWSARDLSIWPAVHFAAQLFGVSEYTMRDIVNGEGGNVNPTTLRASLCSYGGTGWNTQGSDAFGPMQFMLDRRAACFDASSWGTFGSYDDAAFAAARARGVIVPDRYKNPASNVGQAITTAYMLATPSTGGIRHWCASQC